MEKILFIITVSAMISSCGKQGCTDPLAMNYSSKATKDDNSCEYAITNNWKMKSYILNDIDISSNYTFLKLYSYADSSFWSQSLEINDTLTKDTSINFINTYVPDTTITFTDTTYVTDTIFGPNDTTLVDTTITFSDTLIIDSLVILVDSVIIDSLIYDSTIIDIVGVFNLSNNQSEFNLQNESKRTNSNFSSGNDWQLDNNFNKFLINSLSDTLMHLILIGSNDPSINSIELIYEKE